MGPMWTIAAKDLKVLIRDKMAVFWVLGFPLMIAILFGSIFGGSGAASKMKIAIADQDRSADSGLRGIRSSGHIPGPASLNPRGPSPGA